MNSLVFFVYGALLTYASLRPAGTASMEPWDKVFHLMAYAIFALLARRMVAGTYPYYGLCVAIALYGVAMEYAQSFVPGRVMSAADALANSAGVLAAVLLSRAYSRRNQTP
jgi:VanZ family protein